MSVINYFKVLYYVSVVRYPDSGYPESNNPTSSISLLIYGL
jgi:hypothetical protein